MVDLVKLLIDSNKTISVMESCTGGGICNEITNIPDASRVFSFGAVTYSNDAKIKMGVSTEIIDKYTVYSQEIANCMAKSISDYANSNYGVGVTGKLKKADLDNKYGDDDLVYFSIYDRDNDIYYTDSLKVSYDNRVDNKREVINKIVDKLIDII